MAELTAVEKLKERIAVGTPIFEELFKLNDADLKDKLKDILEDSHDDILTNNCDVVRTITNMKPDKISFNYYSSIEINWLGIHFHPEHGGAQQLIKFNKHFKL